VLDIPPEVELHGGTTRSQRCATGTVASRKYESAILQCGSIFQAHVFSHDGERVVLKLLGELDIVSMARFERLLAEVLSSHPKELRFDLTQAQFISAQGYAAMGRCSLEVRVTVRSRTELASRILATYGYDEVMMVISQPPVLEALDQILPG
jgi:anti-anti-sigma regulatory factor